MRRLTAWLAGAAGGAAAFRLLRRRSRGGALPVPTPAPESAAGTDPRANELRAKLDEARREPAAEPAGEAEPDTSPEERRRRVHEQGRAALDEMRPE